MKKQITAIITAALILANFTACSTNNEPLDDTSNNSSSFSESKTENSSNTQSDPENSNIMESNSSENTSGTSFTAPDGGILNESEAVSADDYSLKFDHSYLRYAQPIFYNTLDDSELVNWDTLEFSVDRYAVIEEPNYFKVQAGDKLENGLTVKTAAYAARRDGSMSASAVSFEGEITLEGILYCSSQDDIYYNKGHLQFWADPAKYEYIPIPCGSDYASDQVDWFVDPENKTAFVFDGYVLSFGTLEYVTVDLSEVISYGESIRAKVTFKDPRMSWSGSSKSTAGLVSVERLSD